MWPNLNRATITACMHTIFAPLFAMMPHGRGQYSLRIETVANGGTGKGFKVI